MGKTRRKHAISPLSPTQIRDKNLEINQIYRFTTFAEEGSNGKQEWKKQSCSVFVIWLLSYSLSRNLCLQEKLLAITTEIGLGWNYLPR